MAKQTRTTLKGYFETGDTPSQAQYADLIDSKLNLSENNTGNIQITGNLTASGNISASGTITSGTITSQNFILGSGGSILATDTSGNTNDVIVGNLADVGLFFGDIDMPSTFRATTFDFDASSTITLNSDSGLIELRDGAATSRIQFNTTSGHITASGNISGSGTSTGSFGSLKVNGSSVDFSGLPTSDPGVAGRLYNDSGNIKISL